MSDDRCFAIRELLPWYVNGTIHSSARAEVDAHLRTCAACQQELARWQNLAQAVRVAPLIPDSAASARTTRANIHQATSEQVFSMKEISTMNASTPPPIRSERSFTRRSIFPVIVAVLVGLIIYSTVWFTHQRNVLTPGASTATTVTYPSPVCAVKTTFTGNGMKSQFSKVGQSVAAKGVTVTLDDFSADYTRIMLALTITTSPTALPKDYFSGYSPTGITLKLTSGASLESVDGETEGESTNPYVFHQRVILMPIPLNALGKPQSAIIAIHQMSNGAVLDGRWQLPITFTVSQPHSVSDLDCTSSAFGGYNIVPTSIGIAPGAAQLDGNPGGVRIDVCVGGAAQFHFLPFYIYYKAKDGSGIGEPVIDPTKFMKVLLTLPDGRQILPQLDPFDAPCSVGSQAGLMYHFLYLTTLSKLSGHFTFAVPYLLLDGKTQAEQGTTPWHYSFDLK